MSRTLPKPCILLLLLISILLVGCQAAIPPSSAPRQPGLSFSLPDDRPEAPTRTQVAFHSSPAKTPAVSHQAGALPDKPAAAPKQDPDLTLELADSLMNVFEVFTGRR